MAHFIFSSERFLARLTQLHQEQLQISQSLLRRLGVKPSVNEIITILVIAEDPWEGYSAIFTLSEQCQKMYRKQIDMDKIKPVVLPNLEAASKSPHLERASFVIILGEDLLGAENYPELANILPFKAG